MKLHALRRLAWLPDEENHLTLCHRHVPHRSQLAAFDSGVTCKQCLAIIRFNEANAEISKIRLTRGK
jgi:transcription initiation factor IIE alpha subunit